MNKTKMIDTAQLLVRIAEDISANIEDVDFAEVRQLLAQLTVNTQLLSSAIEKGR